MPNEDFIPEGKDSAYGVGGFRDFIPAPEPKASVEPVVAEPKKRGKK